MDPQMMALLGGGGGGGVPAPADPAAAGGLPPELAALLGGGGAAPAEAAQAPGGDPQEMYQVAMDATDDTAVLTQWAIDAMTKAAQLDPDEEDRLLIQKNLTGLQQYLATHQKRGDMLVQGKADPAALRMAEAGY